MSDGGYVGHVLISADGEPVEPNVPWVMRVREAPGTAAEMLTLIDGSRTFLREGLTVFATEREAREDAQRRIDEAELAKFIHSGLQEQEAVEIPITKLVEVFVPGGGVEDFRRSKAEEFAARFGWVVSQQGAVTGGLTFREQKKGGGE